MSCTPEKQYVLTNQKFKKTARGLQRRLSLLMTENNTLPLQSVMQALSQELFSMPYEEAKATILISGTPLTLNTEKKAATPLPKMTAQNISPGPWRELVVTLDGVLPEGMRHNTRLSISVGKVLLYMSALHHYFPTTRFAELRRYESWLAGVQKKHPALLQALWVDTRAQNTCKKYIARTALLDERCTMAMSALGGTLEQKIKGKPLSLRDIEGYLANLKNFAELAFDESVSKMHRASLLILLDSINYARPSPTPSGANQSDTTLEQFDHIVMEPLWLVSTLLKEIESLG